MLLSIYLYLEFNFLTLYKSKYLDKLLYYTLSTRLVGLPHMAWFSFHLD